MFAPRVSRQFSANFPNFHKQIFFQGCGSWNFMHPTADIARKSSPFGFMLHKPSSTRSNLEAMQCKSIRVLINIYSQHSCGKSWLHPLQVGLSCLQGSGIPDNNFVRWNFTDLISILEFDTLYIILAFAVQTNTFTMGSEPKTSWCIL